MVFLNSVTRFEHALNKVLCEDGVQLPTDEAETMLWNRGQAVGTPELEMDWVICR